MPKPSSSSLVLPIVMITVGVGWLLTAQGYGPGINWIWTLALGVIGILAFVLSGGLDKVSVVIGPFFLLASLLSLLRQTGKLPIDTEVPILVIVVGVLLLVARSAFIPPPAWILQSPRGE